jgi:hypothetical protein
VVLFQASLVICPYEPGLKASHEIMGAFLLCDLASGDLVAPPGRDQLIG